MPNLMPTESIVDHRTVANPIRAKDQARTCRVPSSAIEPTIWDILNLDNEILERAAEATSRGELDS